MKLTTGLLSSLLLSAAVEASPQRRQQLDECDPNPRVVTTTVYLPLPAEGCGGSTSQCSPGDDSPNQGSGPGAGQAPVGGTFISTRTIVREITTRVPANTRIVEDPNNPGSPGDILSTITETITTVITQPPFANPTTGSPVPGAPGAGAPGVGAPGVGLPVVSSITTPNGPLPVPPLPSDDAAASPTVSDGVLPNNSTWHRPSSMMPTLSVTPILSEISVLPESSAAVSSPALSSSIASASPVPSVSPAGAYKNVLYFTNWGIYAADHQPQDFPAEDVTHLLYAFADIEEDGEVVGSDSWADVEMRFPNDAWGEDGDNAYGIIKQLFLRKQANRHLKLLLSIGGWTWSYKFVPVAATEEGRRRFAESAVQLMADWGFDGLDIDWEYPQDAAEAADYVRLLAAVRTELDAYAAENAPGYHFQLTVAVPAGAVHYTTLDLVGMAPLVDGFHLMAYDYSGSWDAVAGHQANLFQSESNPDATPADTDTAVRYYLTQGVEPRDIMLGVPLYGRSFTGTDGLGQPFTGVGAGSVEPGIYHYKDLPLIGSEELWDDEAIASYSYDESTRELVSYDDVRAATEKTSYLVQNDLGGAIFWESAGDRQGEGSLVRTVAREMGPLDQTQNLLDYPGSRYDNIRNGMPGQ